MSRVGVVGAGYVGLTTAACFARLGHDVVCADADPGRVERLRAGEAPFPEPGLDDLLVEGLSRRRLQFAHGAAGAARDRDFVFLCVPTPTGPDDAADLGSVRAALADIAPVLAAGAVVVAKSTMPPGSAHLARRLLDAHRGDGPPVGVAANPEFLREGSAVADFLHPHRIVIGSDDPGVAPRVAALYKGIQAPLLVTDCGTAEMIKYASNAFLATKISFANAVANLCEALDTDVRAVMLGMGYDPRIGFEFLRPGPGYGGSCLPKDVSALIRAAHDAGYDFSLLRGVDAVNRAQQDRIVAKVASLAPGGELAGARVAAWGTAFKAGTDDLRESPAVAVIDRLLAGGAEVRAYDPVAPRPALPPDRFTVCADAYDACRDADVVVVLTEWDEFCGLDYAKVHDLMRAPAIVDARNLLDPAPLRRRGFRYAGVGRRDEPPGEEPRAQ